MTKDMSRVTVLLVVQNDWKQREDNLGHSYQQFVPISARVLQKRWVKPSCRVFVAPWLGVPKQQRG